MRGLQKNSFFARLKDFSRSDGRKFPLVRSQISISAEK